MDDDNHDIFGSDDEDEATPAPQSASQDGAYAPVDQAADDLFGADDSDEEDMRSASAPPKPKGGQSSDMWGDSGSDLSDDEGVRGGKPKKLGRLQKGGAKAASSKLGEDKGKRRSKGEKGDKPKKQKRPAKDDKSADPSKSKKRRLVSKGDGDRSPKEGGDPAEAGKLKEADIFGTDSEGEEAPRGKADDDFIDNDGDDLDLIMEYDGDAPPPGSDSEAEEDEPRRDRGGKSESNNPLDEVLRSLKRSKKQELSLAERDAIAQDFLHAMSEAAERDAKNVGKGKPALAKISCLERFLKLTSKKDLQETLLEFDLLTIFKQWLEPYENNSLPSLTVRTALIDRLTHLNISRDHLKSSKGLGMVVMNLFRHPEETSQNKQKLKLLLERWNRMIFNKCADFRGSVGIQSFRDPEDRPSAKKGHVSERVETEGSLEELARRRDSGVVQSTRARVPQNRGGYAFKYKPADNLDPEAAARASREDKGSKAKLTKHMQLLSRVGQKNQRAVKMSIEGRGIK